MGDTTKMEDKMGALHPRGNQVVAVQEKPEEKTTSGIFLTTEAQTQNPIGVVEAIGPDVHDLGAGDRIVYKEYAATEIVIDKVTYLVFSSDDIIAILGENDG